MVYELLSAQNISLSQKNGLVYLDKLQEGKCPYFPWIQTNVSCSLNNFWMAEMASRHLNKLHGKVYKYLFL